MEKIGKLRKHANKNAINFFFIGDYLFIVNANLQALRNPLPYATDLKENKKMAGSFK